MISKDISAIGKVAHRFRKEVGVPRTMALRISRKLNELASSVDWATPLPDGRRVYAFTTPRRAKRKKKK